MGRSAPRSGWYERLPEKFSMTQHLPRRQRFFEPSKRMIRDRQLSRRGRPRPSSFNTPPKSLRPTQDPFHLIPTSPSIERGGAMSKSTDIRVLDVQTAFDRLTFRAPLKFGGRVVEHYQIANVKITVETRSGKRGVGFGSMPIGHIWAWPTLADPAKTERHAIARRMGRPSDARLHRTVSSAGSRGHAGRPDRSPCPKGNRGSRD